MNRIEQVTVAEDSDLEVNMTPMLDIVFIMLIFFIVTAVFIKESGIEVIRPDADLGKSLTRVSAVVGISQDNTIWIDRKEIALPELRAVVMRLKQENPKGNIVLTADAESRSGLVVAVVKELNSVGIKGVAIATKTGG